MPEIRLSQLTKSYPPDITAVRDVELTVRDGERLVLVGPSGCGKSTTLRLIAGLEQPDRGQILFDGQDVTCKPASKRHVSMVFQSENLFPHLNVRDNLTVGLKMRQTASDVITRRVAEIVDRLGLEPWLERWPHELSGGERQRVALGRILVDRTPVCLLDEPLSNIDPAMRNDLRLTIRSLHRDLNSTFLYVTHDQVEAMTLGQRLAVMNEGCILQVGRPEDIYRSPANTFVARFIGSPPMNLFPALVQDGQLHWFGQSIPVERELDNGPIVVGARPEHFVVGLHKPLRFECSVAAVEFLGAEQIVHVVHAGRSFAVRVREFDTYREGTSIVVACDPKDVQLFESEPPGERIS